MNYVEVKSIETKFGNLTAFTQAMKVKEIVNIYYIAVRGKDQEEGAVQRVLNKQRIKSIKRFILEGNIFFSTFILNWTNSDFTPEYKNGKFKIPVIHSAAQMIDGQHRIVGLEDAMEENAEIGEKEILVTFCVDLSTKEAAQIFANINSEQKPVPKSLIFDLFGEIETDTNHSINRATDIADELNSNINSAYYGAIKYPGKPRGMGIIDLSTVVNSLKKHLEVDGAFASHNHSGTIHYFIDLFGGTDVILSQKIEDKNSYVWLMEKREQVNYRERSFNEPLPPDFLIDINKEIEEIGIESLIRKIIEDEYILTFQPEYAALAIPIKRAIETKKVIDK